MTMPEVDYSNLRALLVSQETFPHAYVHKIIGRNTAAFAESVQRLEVSFPYIRLETARTSKGEAHLALTYIIQAQNPDQIIDVLRETGNLTDLHLIL